ncbi:hypothetical protein [uncultured Brevundimonas sp.]|uniref:hypothetical protein n=1 Tax=uncultured Brevundimonas sp. TaxID=213418 RepID=UPI0025E36BE8|nr:hypothetical protein [uncultured Brevundimonas sp.]
MSSAPVHIVLEKPTTFIEGRRLLLDNSFSGDHFSLTDEIRNELPNPVKDRARLMLLRIDFIGEQRSNSIAALVAPLLPWKRFWLVGGLTAATGMALSIWSLLETFSPSVALPTWRTIVIHYVVLGVILAWHELGHLAAVKRAGLRADGLGGGFYLVFPALFSKISLIFLASYRDKMRIYASGVVFQSMLAIAASLSLLMTDDALLRFAVAANLSTLVLNLVPGMKLDGHRMVDEVIAQPWSRRYRPALRLLTLASGIAIIALAIASLSAWLWAIVPIVFQSPSITGLVIIVIPTALLMTYTFALARGISGHRA